MAVVSTTRVTAPRTTTTASQGPTPEPEYRARRKGIMRARVTPWSTAEVTNQAVRTRIWRASTRRSSIFHILQSSCGAVSGRVGRGRAGAVTGAEAGAEADAGAGLPDDAGAGLPDAGAGPGDAGPRSWLRHMAA